MKKREKKFQPRTVSWNVKKKDNLYMFTLYWRFNIKLSKNTKYELRINYCKKFKFLPPPANLKTSISTQINHILHHTGECVHIFIGVFHTILTDFCAEMCLFLIIEPPQGQNIILWHFHFFQFHKIFISRWQNKEFISSFHA